MDGVDAVVADFAAGTARPCVLLAAAHLPFARDLARRAAGAAASGQRRARPRDARRQCAGRHLCGRDRRCTARRRTRGDGRGRGRGPWPDTAPSPRRRLDVAAQQPGARRRACRACPSSPISAAATSRPAARVRRWCRPFTRRSSAAGTIASSSMSAASPTSRILPVGRNGARLRHRPRQRALRSLACASSRRVLRPGRRVGTNRTRRRGAAGGAAGRALLRARAAEEHRTRSVRPGLARVAGSASATSRRPTSRRHSSA